MSAIAVQHKADIIKRLSTGEHLKSIADDLGISVPAISQQLAKDEDYRAAREQSLEARLDQREDEVEASTDMLNLARARELLSHARWRCEREAPHRWGKDSSVNIQINNLNPESILDKASDLLKSTIETNTKLSGE